MQDGAYSKIYTWSNVPGNAGYEVSLDKINWVPANAPISPASHGTNIFSPTFYARALNTGICSYGLTSPPFDCSIVVPNLLTPNGDGQNDVFLIANINLFPDNTFKVLNRWGVEVYGENGYNNTTKVFTGDGLTPGRYFYSLDLGNGAGRKSGSLIISK